MSRRALGKQLGWSYHSLLERSHWGLLHGLALRGPHEEA
jgi:hypothetical protein